MIVYAVFFSILIILLIVVLFLMKIYEREEENLRVGEYTDAMKGLYETLSERCCEMRKYRHDLAKHIRTLESLKGKTLLESETIKEYTENLKERYASCCKGGEFCSDEIINSVLTLKGSECKEKNILFSAFVSDDFYGDIDGTDAVGLIYNLLDNAVEENERISDGERFISFFMDRAGDVIHLELKNSTAIRKRIDFRTEKAKKDEHGFGTRIIADVIKKYGGENHIEFSASEKVFAQKIVLYTSSERRGH